MNTKRLFCFLLLCGGICAREAFAQVRADLEEPLGAPVMQADDASSGVAAPAAFNQHRPPNVGPTIIVSAPQFFSTTTPPLGLVGRSETAIAVNAGGKNIVIGWNDADGFIDPTKSLSGYAFSVDGGKTFTDGGSFPFGTYLGQPVVPLGDPWLDVDGNGNGTFYASHLALRPDLATEVGLIVFRGAIQNKTLNWSSSSIIPAPSFVVDFLDKEALAADKRGGSRSVYVSTTNFTAFGSQIEVYRSTDGATTWNGPAIAKAPDANGQQGSDVVVGPGGEVYVTWERGRFAAVPAILFAASTDGGATFTPFTTVASITGTALFPPVGYNRSRSNDFPRIAVDQTTNHSGRIYVVYHDAGNNANVHTDGLFTTPAGASPIPTGGVRDGDIYLKYSDDRGATWSTPTLVSSAAPGDGKNQFWPVVSVEPGGNVDVVYYQDTEVFVGPNATVVSIDNVGGGRTRRRSSYQSLVDVFWAQSRDGGVTFETPVQVNAVASNWSIAASNIRPNFGDYIASVSAGNKIYASWAQSELYDIDPTSAVNNRFVPSAAFAGINGVGQAWFKQGVVDDKNLPTEISLGQNFPNPFNPSTVISYGLPDAAHVSLKMFNPLGQEVATLVDGNRAAGTHSEVFDARNLASGMYFYRLQVGNLSAMKKLVLLK